MRHIAIIAPVVVALLTVAPDAHARPALCSQAALELYVFYGEYPTGCYLPQQQREKLEAARLHYLDRMAEATAGQAEQERQHRERMADLDRLQAMVDAMPSAPSAPYVDSYIAPFADQPFRTCKVYPGAGVDCTGF